MQGNGLPEALAIERLHAGFAGKPKKPTESDHKLIQEQLDEEAADKKAQNAIALAKGDISGKDLN